MAVDDTRSRVSGSSLSLYEAMELALLAGKNVDGHWTQFYTCVFSLVALANLTALQYKHAVILSVAAASFFALNAIATARAYWVLNLIIMEATEIAKRSEYSSDTVRRQVSERNPRVALPLRIPIAILGHMVAAGTVIYLTWRSVPG
jgi:hypothetical protein